MNAQQKQGIQSGSPLDTVLSRLHSVSQTTPGEYTACCPAHDDRTPSLSVTEDSGGTVLLHCHAGCSAADVVEAIGLQWRDLFPDDVDASWKPWEGDLVDRYTYHDADGSPLFQVVRYEMRDPDHPAYGDKSFMQHGYLPEHPDAGKYGRDPGYVPGRSKHGIEPVLYRLPRVLKAIEYGDTVYLVEGEKDVQTLERLGLTATCNPGGASKGSDPGKKWTPEMTAALQGASVVCLPDNDAPGRAFMTAVADKIVQQAASVRIVTLPRLRKKEDVTDWMRLHDGTPQELRTLVETTDPHRWTPRTAADLVAYCEAEGTADDVFEHIDLLAAVPLDRYPTLKKRIRAATDINLNDLRAAVEAGRKRLKEEQEAQDREDRRKALEEEAPVIRLDGRPSADVVDDLLDAIETANDPPMLFRRSEIVWVPDGPDGTPEIQDFSESELDDLISRCTSCVDEDMLPSDPSLRLVRRVADRVDLPRLDGITHVPILRPDGTVRDAPGYDEPTHLLYRPPDGTSPPTVPDEPTEQDVREALALVEEAWRDHPFADDASRAAAFALALTLIVRPLLDSANIPLLIIDATRAGSGKSLLAEIIGIMGTGATPATMSAPTGDAEWRKQITAQLRAGERFIIVDDVSGTLDSASLRRAVTSTTWSDRILGVSTQMRVPSTAVWCATGNNLRPRGDMVRRCFLLRLDTEMSQPWTRTGFTHPQPQWTRENRSALAAALLTLARSWIVAGRPEPTHAPVLGSFERWRTVVGGILEHVGVEDFLGNIDALTDSVFVEDEDWARLLEAIHAWEAQRDKKGFTVRELARDLEGAMRTEDAIRDDDVMEIVEWLPDDLRSKLRYREPIVRSLANSFAYRKDRRFAGGWHLKITQQDRAGKRWTVARDEDASESRDSTTPNSQRTRMPTPPSANSKVGVGGDSDPLEDLESWSRTAPENDALEDDFDGKAPF